MGIFSLVYEYFEIVYALSFWITKFRTGVMEAKPKSFCPFSDRRQHACEIDLHQQAQMCVEN